MPASGNCKRKDLTSHPQDSCKMPGVWRVPVATMPGRQIQEDSLERSS